jgi:hypothetical protein
MAMPFVSTVHVASVIEPMLSAVLPTPGEQVTIAIQLMAEKAVNAIWEMKDSLLLWERLVIAAVETKTKTRSPRTLIRMAAGASQAVIQLAVSTRLLINAISAISKLFLRRETS